MLVFWADGLEIAIASTPFSPTTSRQMVGSFSLVGILNAGKFETEHYTLDDNWRVLVPFLNAKTTAATIMRSTLQIVALTLCVLVLVLCAEALSDSETRVSAGKRLRRHHARAALAAKGTNARHKTHLAVKPCCVARAKVNAKWGAGNKYQAIWNVGIAQTHIFDKADPSGNTESHLSCDSPLVAPHFTVMLTYPQPYDILKKCITDAGMNVEAKLAAGGAGCNKANLEAAGS